MPLQLVRNDITKMDVDAIVNAANSSLLGGGGVDGAIHRAAGPGLLEECRTLGGCPTGEAKITKGYDLPAKFVIHTVGPVWNGGTYGEETLLRSCYRNSLQLAAENGCGSVAFPLISAGVYGYPKDKALRVAIDAVSGFLLERDPSQDMMVYLVLFGRDTLHLGRALFPGLQEFIDDHYAEEHGDWDYERRRWQQIHGSMPEAYGNAAPTASRPSGASAPSKPYSSAKAESSAAVAGPETAPSKEKRRISILRPRKKKAGEPAFQQAQSQFGSFSKTEEALPTAAETGSLDDMLAKLDESFTQMVLRKIDESGLTDAECYKRANIDRKLFSKIRSDLHYKPSKKTAVALAVALRLDLAETNELLRKAGFALSHSSVFDLIIEYFISNGKYNIFEINEALFAYDQMILG